MSVLAAEAVFPYDRYIEITQEGIFDFLQIQEKHSHAKTCRVGLKKKYVPLQLAVHLRTMPTLTLLCVHYP